MVVFQSTWNQRSTWWYIKGSRRQQPVPWASSIVVATSVDQPRRVVVVGGGAAGLTAAYFAAQSPQTEVVVLEKNTQTGRKILISGGTRCNVLPLQVDLDRDYFTDSSRSALRAVFSTWSLSECRAWMEHNLGVALQLEEETGKLFPASNSAQQVRDALLGACETRGVTVRYGCDLHALQACTTRCETKDDPKGGAKGGAKHAWQVKCKDGSVHPADAVVVATGGLSFPILGASDAGQRALEQLGHTLTTSLYPALTPLISHHPGGQQLAGLTLTNVDLTWAVNKGEENLNKGGKRKGKRKQVSAMRKGMVFTHRGVSGPAVLDLSHHVVLTLQHGHDHAHLIVNWCGVDAATWETLLSQGGPGLVVNVVKRQGVPQRLAHALCAEIGVQDRPLAGLRKTERSMLIRALTEYPLTCTGHEGFPKAEVTGGGVPLEQINCRTMESRVVKQPGCFMCGEVLDVHGRIGGFNFWWAWCTGRAAGLAAGKGGEGGG